MTIFVSGSVAYDRIMDFPGRFEDHILPEKIHILNVCFTVNGLIERFGGTAGNIAYSLALLDEKPLILAAAGKDFDSYRQWLNQNQLSTTGIREIDSEFTAGAYITTDLSDNQITGFNPGAMKHSSIYDFDGVDPDSALAIVAPGNVDDMLAYTRRYKQLQIPYIFDPGQQIPVIAPEHLAEMIDGAHILISNDYELEMIKNTTGMDNAQLTRICGTVITTLGDKGSTIRADGVETAIGTAAAAQVVDPTGAGDAYRAGLIKGLVTDRELPTAARMGAVCASFAVEMQGTQVHRFDQKAFNERYQRSFGDAET